MKKLIYILSVITILFSSCTQENLPDRGEQENCITLKIKNSSMKTKATMKGSEVENTINTLDFFFFPQGRTEENSTFYKRVTFNGGIQDEADVHLYITDDEFGRIFPNNQNNAVVFVIANLPDGLLPTGDSPTKLQALKQIQLVEEFIDEDGNPVTPTSFVMQGEQTLTKSSNTANSVTGEVKLYRAASKITLRLKLPDYILVPTYDQEGNPYVDENGNAVNQIWTPEFSAAGASAGIEDTFVSLRNGVSADYVAGEYTPTSSEYFNTKNIGDFTFVSSVASYDEMSTGANIHTYTCDVTFYSYSSKWNSGDLHAPCFILQIPWKNNTDNKYVTHYYQVQINSFGKELASNYWYDLTLNVGVLGSTVATLPLEIKSLSYTVLDWSTIMTVFDRTEEEIHLDEWQYLIIDESQVVMNNTTTGTFYFDASHSLAWNLEWPDQDEMTSQEYNFIVNEFDEIERKYNSSTKHASYYLDCSELNAKPVCLNEGNRNWIDNSCFTEEGRQFTFHLPDEITDQTNNKIYSPVYVHVKVWLDMDDDDDLDDNEKDYVYHLTFVYNPAMYVTPDSSTLESIYVNGVYHETSAEGTAVTIKGQNLGSAAGRRNDNNQSEYNANNRTINYPMYVINVTSFNASNKFTWNGTQYNYIIGDPRVRKPDTALNAGVVENDYASASAVELPDGEQRSLKYYYPTSSEDNAFQVVAPKFRIVSFNNASRSVVTPLGAALRCATMQEDGFPAGRWRLPTVAEIQYIIYLQQQGAIEPIFTSTTSRYMCASLVDGVDTRWGMRLNGNNVEYVSIGPNNRYNNTTGSVRCVYDEWYWGSERDAKINPNPTRRNQDRTGSELGDYYLFTWGDKLIY